MPLSALAQGADPGTPYQASFEGRCDNPPENFPECATTPADCESNTEGNHPLNCLFLEEPLGGRPGYDLFTVSCQPDPRAGAGQDTEATEEDVEKPAKLVCNYTLWFGEVIINDGNTRGPLQAVLAFEKGKEYQGPFGLLYNYLQLIYNYISGLIIAFVIFICVVAGVMISTSAGDAEKARKGKDMIVNSLIGMAVWFLASVILYTINPTFFNF